MRASNRERPVLCVRGFFNLVEQVVDTALDAFACHGDCDDSGYWRVCREKSALIQASATDWGLVSCGRVPVFNRR